MKYQVQENCLTIFLPREVDHHHAEEIRKNADMVIEKNHIKYVIFDFERTEFMDSSGVGLLMGRYRAMGMRKESIQAVGVSRHIDRLLHLSGLHRYIEIQKAEEEEA